MAEIIVSAILIILLVLFLNPFGFWMPDMYVMTLILGLIVAFSVFASLIWKERARDEREYYHLNKAGRIAYLVGSGVLVIGIIVQTINHNLDYWLVATLGVMVLAKIFGLLYIRQKH